MTAALLLAVLLVPARAQTAPAPAAASCELKDPQNVGATQAYAGRMRSGKCFVDVQPGSTEGMRYRDYTFFDDGLLLAFSSYGTGSNSAATAAREYYFFPRGRKPSLRLDAAAKTLAGGRPRRRVRVRDRLRPDLPGRQPRDLLLLRVAGRPRLQVRRRRPLALAQIALSRPPARFLT